MEVAEVARNEIQPILGYVISYSHRAQSINMDIRITAFKRIKQENCIKILKCLANSVFKMGLLKNCGEYSEI
jgi:hypothetical protein